MNTYTQRNILRKCREVVSLKQNPYLQAYMLPWITRHAINRTITRADEKGKRFYHSECSNNSFFGSNKNNFFSLFCVPFPQFHFLCRQLSLLPFSALPLLLYHATKYSAAWDPAPKICSNAENTDYAYDFPCWKNLVLREKRAKFWW